MGQTFERANISGVIIYKTWFIPWIKHTLQCCMESVEVCCYGFTIISSSILCSQLCHQALSSQLLLMWTFWGHQLLKCCDILWDLFGYFEWCLIKENMYKIIDSQRKVDVIVLNFVVSTGLADGLAPLGARPSASSVMTKTCPVYIYWTSTWKVRSSSHNTTWTDKLCGIKLYRYDFSIISVVIPSSAIVHVDISRTLEYILWNHFSLISYVLHFSAATDNTHLRRILWGSG